MNLGRCIVNLLRQHPVVGVPGIGVFSIKRIPASFDQEQSVFIPPANHIEFVADNTGGFPVTDYLKAQGQVDEATAASLLNKAVQELFDAIDRNGRVLLEGIGYLVAEGQSLVLKPFEARGLGFKPVKERAQAVGEEAVVGNREPVAAVGGASKSRIARWVAAALVLVLLSAGGLAWYYKPTWFDQERIFQFFGKATSEGRERGGSESPRQIVLVEVPVSDSTVVDSAFKENAIVDSDSAASPAVTQSVPESPKPSVTYEIIVGSFATMRQAEKYVADMKAKGYHLEAIDSRMPGNRKKISWGSFATEEEAYRELARVQKTFEPTAWIAKVEND